MTCLALAAGGELGILTSNPEVTPASFCVSGRPGVVEAISGVGASGLGASTLGDTTVGPVELTWPSPGGVEGLGGGVLPLDPFFGGCC